MKASILCAGERISSLVAGETKAFFGARPDGLVLILDDKESLAAGKFRGEHKLLAALLAERGWETTIGAPDETRFDGRRLLSTARRRIRLNRSTDFFWSSEQFGALRAARAERAVYAAPNPSPMRPAAARGCSVRINRGALIQGGRYVGIPLFRAMEYYTTWG